MQTFNGTLDAMDETAASLYMAVETKDPDTVCKALVNAIAVLSSELAALADNYKD